MPSRLLLTDPRTFDLIKQSLILFLTPCRCKRSPPLSTCKHRILYTLPCFWMFRCIASWDALISWIWGACWHFLCMVKFSQLDSCLRQLQFLGCLYLWEAAFVSNDLLLLRRDWWVITRYLQNFRCDFEWHWFRVRLRNCVGLWRARLIFRLSFQARCSKWANETIRVAFLLSLRCDVEIFKK